MERRITQLRVGHKTKELEVVVKEVSGLDHMGLVVDTDGQFYTAHGILEALVLPDLVEYISSHNNIYSPSYWKEVHRILSSVSGIDPNDYEPMTLIVKWVLLGRSIDIVASDDSEIIVYR